MLRPARLLTVLALGLLVYVVFFALPTGAHSAGGFDPEALADRQVAVWQSVRAKEEFGLFLNVVRELREEQRYSWYKAIVAGYYESHALSTFGELQQRFERVLPDLESAAAIEKDWRNAAFDPAVAARARLTWWVTRRLPNLNGIENVGPLVTEDYATRYRLGSERVAAAGTYVAQAAELRDTAAVDPDWGAIRKMLVEANKSLLAALKNAPRPAAASSR